MNWRVFRFVVASVGLASIGVGAAQPSAHTQWEGIYTAAQAERGGALYVEKCATCHGADLSGLGQASALVGEEMLNNLNRQRFATILDRVQRTMPASAPASLSLDQISDLVSFLLSKNGFPSGDKELPSKLSELRDITFVAKKPN